MVALFFCLNSSKIEKESYYFFINFLLKFMSNTNQLEIIQNAIASLQLVATSLEEAVSMFELESRNEQGAGKPRRSVAEVLADEAARTDKLKSEEQLRILSLMQDSDINYTDVPVY